MFIDHPLMITKKKPKGITKISKSFSLVFQVPMKGIQVPYELNQRSQVYKKQVEIQEEN